MLGGVKKHFELTGDTFSLLTVNVCQHGPAFDIQSVKVKHMLQPHGVAGSPGGGATSAIDPVFKRKRLPAGS